MKLVWTSPLGSVIEIAPQTVVTPPIQLVLLQPGRTGFSTSPTKRHSARTPYGHGQIPLATLYEPRELMIPVILVAESKAGLDALIAVILRAFAPGLGHGTLRWEREDGVAMTLSAEPTDLPTIYTEKDNKGRSGLWVKADIRLTADDPFWYSDEQVAPLGQFEGAFEIPFRLPVSLGSSGPSRTVVNNGHIEAPVTLEIFGPCSNPTVTNHTTGAWFGLDLDVHDNETIVVSADVLHKAVTRVHQITGTETNELNAIRTGSSWLDVVSGENLFGVSTTARGDPIRVDLRWFSRYGGG